MGVWPPLELIAKSQMVKQTHYVVSTMITYITKNYENKGIIYLKDILNNSCEFLTTPHWVQVGKL